MGGHRRPACSRPLGRNSCSSDVNRPNACGEQGYAPLAKPLRARRLCTLWAVGRGRWSGRQPQSTQPYSQTLFTLSQPIRCSHEPRALHFGQWAIRSITNTPSESRAYISYIGWHRYSSSLPSVEDGKKIWLRVVHPPATVRAPPDVCFRAGGGRSGIIAWGAWARTRLGGKRCCACHATVISPYFRLA